MEADENSVYTESRLAGLKPFTAGTSGNPLGRPPGSRNRATIVREILDLMHTSGQTYEYASTMAVAEKAAGGDVTAWEKLMDSAHGKLTDKSQIEMQATVSRVERTIVDVKDGE